jgi:hypothetical protein
LQNAKKQGYTSHNTDESGQLIGLSIQGLDSRLIILAIAETVASGSLSVMLWLLCSAATCALY